MSTTRQRLFTNMAPLLLVLVILVVVAAHLACWYGLFISAKHDDTGWCIFWATLLLTTATHTSRSRN